jgi:hypothetical protein
VKANEWKKQEEEMSHELENIKEENSELKEKLDLNETDASKWKTELEQEKNRLNLF